MDAARFLITGLRWAALALIAALICGFWYMGAAWLSGVLPLTGRTAYLPPATPAAWAPGCTLRSSGMASRSMPIA